MRQIVSPIPLVQKILGQQRADAKTTYRMSTHCLRIEQPEGVLLYHALTGELLLLENEETAMLDDLRGCNPSLWTELVSRRFLVPEGADDMGIADQVRQIAERFQREKKTIRDYHIFTTTACNARCFYCFEAGWGRSSMTEKTARDVARYIAAHCGGKPVCLNWFGGEPLMNTRVINVIVDCLRHQSVEFQSNVTSNGYLFDEALVHHAVAAWNLQGTNITLDGTESVYNQRKAFVNPEGSPYRRVLRNIALLLDAGVRVSVRLNMDGDNERDLYALTDRLSERFSGKPGFRIYPVMLHENLGTNPKHYTAEECRYYAQEFRSMQDYIEKKGVAMQEPLKRGFLVTACKGDNSKVTIVLPDGRLGRCEASRSDGIWGSIYSDEVDEEVLQQWRERKPAEEACKTCAIYPRCLRLKKCPNWAESCTAIEQAAREEKLRRSVRGVYKEWKIAGQS